ncbi:MAG: hypothetical protein IJX37_00320 [Oscillospiraceae bacterium]|nr:hypothetical protein [Oscillospiraceae bacterium]
MRRILYIIILALLFLAPVERLDVAKLEPVQTVALYADENGIVLETDTDNKGRGATVDSAHEDLEQRTPGVIYLDTAEYLLVTQNAVDYVDALRKYLHPSVKVSLWDGEGSVKDAAKYLGVEKDLPKLRQWQATIKNVEKSEN